MTITTDIDQHLPRAHIVLSATSAVQPFIASRHLREGALVCDVSRPFNLAPELAEQRADLRLLSGALLLPPPSSVLGHVEAPEHENALVSCAAETIVLALSGYQSEHLCGRLDIATIEDIGRLAEGLGFSVII
jgi:predicted amino acid dehydrogenase